MKGILLTITLTGSLVALGQAPVNWKVMAVKKSPSGYELQVHGIPAKGWYVYADSSEGLAPVALQWDNEQIVRKEKPAYTSVATYIKDPAFGKLLKVYDKEIAFTQNLQVNGMVPDSLTIIVTGFASNGKEFIPLEKKVVVPLEGGTAAKAQNLKLSTVDLNRPVSTCGNVQNTANRDLFAIFMLGLAGGLLALLTPCVFPMIPVTVSFFTDLGKMKKQGITNGLLYGACILGIYLLASVPFHIIGNINPQIFNTIATSAGVNLFFFVIFILFALSFFGILNIKLPASLANNTGSKGGIFFMALTLAIVSFFCTGPILGSLLVGSLSSEGGAWQLTAGMGGFGMALALPFALFAIFPGWLRALPKSGGWMEVVKKSLAFVELALAIKFLSNADLVKHWGLLKREVFIGLWALIAFALALYLLGTFEQKKYNLYVTGKEKPPGISTGRRFTAFIVLLFALYLGQGITNTSYANLKLLSGFPPPLSYSIYHKDKGITPAVINDYDKALQLSREQHKPILIDFTGWACVNCRKMEEQIWTKPKVSQLIQDKFILVSLYVDDRGKLPGGQTIGDKWATFEQENFNQVSQPLYVIMSPDGKLMNNPVGYTPDEGNYKDWLMCGLEAFATIK